MPLYELKNTLLVAIIYVFRMLGLFMVIPTLAIAWSDKPSISPLQIGIAIGAYGFTQALLQIFLGWLSDFYGRKKIISLGLVLFALGSFIASYYNSIEGVILGRFIQGSGAIAGVLSALLSDITSIENLSKSMAIIGSSIGLSFVLAMFLGPWIYAKFGISVIFLSNAIMALLALVIVIFFIPDKKQNNRGTKNLYHLVQDIKTILRIKIIPIQLFGIFTLHFVLMGIFILIPQLLMSILGLAVKDHGFVYLSVNLVSFAICMPLIFYSEKQRKIKQGYLISISSLLVSLFFMFFQNNYLIFVLGLLLFFYGFTFLEATLPSLVAKYSPLLNKGTSMGLYSTFQFLGAALGSYINGLFLKYYGSNGLLIICSIILLIWSLLTIKMPKPEKIKSIVSVIDKNTSTDRYKYLAEIRAVSGVIEAIILPSSSKICIRYSADRINSNKLKHFGIVI